MNTHTEPSIGIGFGPALTDRRVRPDPVPAVERAALHARVDGRVIVYRQYDVGNAIDLDRACELLASSVPERTGPTRGEAQAIQIKNPPVNVLLASETRRIGSHLLPATISARLFDFAVISMRFEIELPRDMPWPEFAESGNRVDLVRDLTPVFDDHLRALLERIRPAVDRVLLASVTEDYVVFRADALRDREGVPLSTDRLEDEDMVPLLLDERRALSPAARRELLPHRFSYYADDLAILTWNNALVVEPDTGNTDVQYVLEFANAQLLELRVYDELLDHELPKLEPRIAAARARAGFLFGRRFAPLLGELESWVADASEVVERVENALKVTDDVYLARIYAAALEIFRGRTWRAGIDRKLAMLRETYGMLNAESQAARAEALEITIVVLILIEIVLMFVHP